jgi:hypothetical protein
MVGASDVDSSSAYSTSSLSSSEDEGDRRKGRKSSKNRSGLAASLEMASTPWRLAPVARRVTSVTRTLIPRMRYVTSFPSCVRRMNGLACCLTIVMICLERQRR